MLFEVWTPLGSGLDLSRGKQMAGTFKGSTGFVYCGPWGSRNSVERALDQGTKTDPRAGTSCPYPHPRLSIPLLYEVELDHLEGGSSSDILWVNKRNLTLHHNQDNVKRMAQVIFLVSTTFLD